MKKLIRSGVENLFVSRDTVIIGTPVISEKEEETDNLKNISESIIRIDTLYEPKKFILDADITLTGVDTSGHEIEKPVLKIEEFISSRLQPLLNYVFFDENSSEIPSRYSELNKKETESFNEAKLFSHGNFTYILSFIKYNRFKDAKIS